MAANPASVRSADRRRSLAPDRRGAARFAGAGLLLVLGGLLILANQFPRIDKYVNPVEKRALQAMEESVSSPLRIAASALAGLALIAAGIGVGVEQRKAAAGRLADRLQADLSASSLLALLGYSYRRVRAKRAAVRRHRIARSSTVSAGEEG